jgi:hypothetical protein
MTEHLSPPDADVVDLAASALVDGWPADQHGDNLDPAVLEARIEAFRAVSAAVATDITSPRLAVIDHHIEVALAAIDEAPASDPITLESRRAPWSSRRWLAVAAAVAAIALALPLLNSLRDETTNQQLTATGAADTNDDARVLAGDIPAEAGTPTTTSAAPGGSPTPTVEAASAGAGLGDVTSEDELASLVRTAAPALSTTPDPTPPAPSLPSTTLAGATATSIGPATSSGPAPTTSLCDATVRATHPELEPALLITSATLRGVYLEVLVYASGASATSPYRVIAVTPSDCQIVVDRLA